jgi:hypothetical protein
MPGITRANVLFHPIEADQTHSLQVDRLSDTHALISTLNMVMQLKFAWVRCVGPKILSLDRYQIDHMYPLWGFYVVIGLQIQEF